MLKKFTKVLTVWGAVDASICAVVIVYSIYKRIQQDFDNHKFSQRS